MANVGDIEAMSNFALDILKNDDRLANFRKAAKIQAERFDIRNIIPLYEELYQKVIHQQKNESTI
jgi:glycosyltransferase involved in cell wall biosynthesis